jgi:hypothetical protein
MRLSDRSTRVSRISPRRIFSPAAMEFYIACTPGDHPVIPGAGGFRKARWARPGKGKSGGFRVIYFFLSAPGRILHG